MTVQIIYRLLQQLFNRGKMLDFREYSSSLLFPEDEDFIISGQESTAVYMLVSGTVKIRSLSSDGASAVIASLNAPQLLGITEYLLKHETYGASVSASGRCRIIRIPADQMADLFDSYPDTYRIIAPYLASLAVQNMNEAESRKILNNNERLALYLINRCSGQLFPCYLKEPRQRIADGARLNLRTLYRCVDSFTKRGLISHRRNRLFITENQYKELCRLYFQLV